MFPTIKALSRDRWEATAALAFSPSTGQWGYCRCSGEAAHSEQWFLELQLKCANMESFFTEGLKYLCEFWSGRSIKHVG